MKYPPIRNIIAMINVGTYAVNVLLKKNLINVSCKKNVVLITIIVINKIEIICVIDLNFNVLLIYFDTFACKVSILPNGHAFRHQDLLFILRIINPGIIIPLVYPQGHFLGQALQKMYGILK